MLGIGLKLAAAITLSPALVAAKGLLDAYNHFIYGNAETRLQKLLQKQHAQLEELNRELQDLKEELQKGLEVGNSAEVKISLLSDEHLVVEYFPGGRRHDYKLLKSPEKESEKDPVEELIESSSKEEGEIVQMKEIPTGE